MAEYKSPHNKTIWQWKSTFYEFELNVEGATEKAYKFYSLVS